MKTIALLTTDVPGFPKRSGKVRDLYELPSQLLIIATDRISAFDVVMPNGIPDKGRVLTQLSLFWFNKLRAVVANHIIPAELNDLPASFRNDQFDGRFMLCTRAKPLPIECVVRGYLAGSGWKEYQANGTICGIELPAGLTQCQELPEPIFTPATKADLGSHDENISFEQAVEIVGLDMAQTLRRISLELYSAGHHYARDRGVIIADTKFEFGVDDSGQLLLIDEVLTPDSSRFWPTEKYQIGRDQESFDKQFVRNYLEQIEFDKTPPAPVLPRDIVQATREKYVEAYTLLTGQQFPWQ
ncbi:MAG: phosphoribosylaminoimidazolesuccinocarboxamide synthase [Planctomycetes bacterium]|nr:phosphoribosylaminoimidazolesuccinocarboxamide synthase [Planctomycetota bacterium]